jgi:hypothetical protein
MPKCETCRYDCGDDGWCPNCAGRRPGEPGVHGRRIEPLRTPQGSLCGTCDSTAGCSHARFECSRCGRTGLAENWPFGCCVR